jgi:5,10-methylenetetrahydromethanopterin reductase
LLTNLRFGLELPTDLLSTEESVALAKLAEQHRVDALWLQEGIVRDVISLAGAIAQATSTLRIATGPVNVWTRTPYLLAMTAATLAELTNGRFVLGLTPGHARNIETNHGIALIPLDDAPSRVREVVQVLTRLISGDRVDFSGQFIHVSEAQLKREGQPPVPIYLNARQGEMLEVAGELIDGAILSIATPEWVREWAIPHIATGAKRAGRDPASVDVAYHPILCLNSDENVAIEAARNVLRPYFRNSEVISLLQSYGFAAEAEGIKAQVADGGEPDPSNDLVRAITLVGSPAEVSERIESYRAAGVTYMVIRPYPSGDESAAAATEIAITSLIRS